MNPFIVSMWAAWVVFALSDKEGIKKQALAIWVASAIVLIINFIRG